jgi:hypothetical protein
MTRVLSKAADTRRSVEIASIALLCLSFVATSLTQAQTEKQTVSFDLGAERCLLITADNVRVVGWDGPGVKCELEKVVMSADGKPDDEELKAIKLVHRHGRDPQKVGRTRAEIAADEERFQASETGQKLSPEASAQRGLLVEEISRSWSHLADFQGKDIDMLDIEGLSFQEGNRQFRWEALTGKGRTVGSEWRRHASVTVFVPRANCVAICGGGVHNLGLIDVENLQASLVLSSSGTRKTSANHPFQVRQLEGSLRIKQVPLDVIDGVAGNVEITATVDLADHGTRHGGGAITGTRQPPLACACKNIRGDFVAWFGRVNLELENIEGRIDVRNEFGDTKVTVKGRPGETAHRVISEAGRIELSLSRGAWGDFPIWAATQAGTYQATAPPSFFGDFSIGTPDAEGVQRSWVGIRRPAAPADRFDPRDFQASAARPRLALRGDDRPPGFDIISRGGAVFIETVE